MKYLIFVFGMFYGIMRGLGEALVMYQANVRDHPWYGYYHWIGILEAILCMATAITVFCWLKRQSVKHIVDVLKIACFLIGILLLLWEGFEISYYFGRMGQVVFGHENILGIYTVESKTIVGCIHGLRVLAGLVLIRHNT